MWHAFNLVASGDLLTATTVRKVKSEGTTGSVETKKVRTTVTLKVATVDFDTTVGVMRVSGTNAAENRFIRLGAHHTLELELQRPFTLEKGCWDLITLKRIEDACDPRKTSDLAAVVLEEGLAHICLVTASMTLTMGKVEVSVPRKRKGIGSQYDKAVERFFDQVLEGVTRHIDFDVVQCVVLAGPGFTRDRFMEYMNQWAVQMDSKALIKNKGKFISVHASSGHKHALQEVLADPAVVARMSDTKATRDIKVLDEFYSTLGSEPDKAYYGYDHVVRANEMQAIDVLMVTDSLFRSADIPTRRRYVALVETAQENGADLRIFSSLHSSGERLEMLSGIAALLRYPLPDIADDQSSDSSSDDEGDMSTIGRVNSSSTVSHS